MRLDESSKERKELTHWLKVNNRGAAKSGPIWSENSRYLKLLAAILYYKSLC